MLWWIAIGGCFGAILRFWLAQVGNTRWPWGTLLANLLGSFALGWLVAAMMDERWLSLWGTGLCGALTTFSTLQMEALAMLRRRAWSSLILYLLATYVLGFVCCYWGYRFG